MKRQLGDLFEARQAMREEAADETFGFPNHEVEKGLYGLMAVEGFGDGPLFGNGDGPTFRETMEPIGREIRSLFMLFLSAPFHFTPTRTFSPAALNGNVANSALLGFVRSVLRQSTASPSTIFIGKGVVTFTLNATTETGFQRRLW